MSVLVGGIAGALLFGPATGWVLAPLGLDQQGLRSLLLVLVGAAVGSFLGGGVAVWVAFRSEHRRARRVNAGAVVVGGPVVFFPLWRYLEPLEWDWLSPQVVLAVALILVGLAGRWLALRTRAPD